jgi:hypothetical protein
MSGDIIQIDQELFGDIRGSGSKSSNDDPMGLKFLTGEEKGISLNLDEDLGARSNSMGGGGGSGIRSLGELNTESSQTVAGGSGTTSGDSGGLFGNFRFSTMTPSEEAVKKAEEVPKSAAEIMREKNELLAKLTAMERRGVNLSRTYDVGSDIEEIRAEYGRIKAAREIENSIKFQRKMLMASVTAIEFLNNRFDPFDVELEGWSESVHESVEDYDEVFEELYEKYKGRAQIAPEIKLMMMLGGSAFMFHLTKTMFKSSIPGMDEILRQNPEIARQVAAAAARTMAGATSNGEGQGQSQAQASPMGGGGFNLGNMMGMLGGLMGGGGGGGGGAAARPAANTPMGRGAAPVNVRRQAPSASRPEMDGPGDVDAILRELDRSATPSVQGISLGRGNQRVSVERSDANTLVVNV